MYWKEIEQKTIFPNQVLKYNKDIILNTSFDSVKSRNKELDTRYSDYLKIDNHIFGEKFLKLSRDLINTGFIIDVPVDSTKNKVEIAFDLDNENPVILDHNLILCKENSHIDIYISYKDDGEVNGFHNGFTKIYIEKGSKVNIYRIQDYSKNITNFDTNIAFVEEDAELTIIDIQLGSSLKGVSYDVELEGDNSICEIKTIYIGTENDIMDFNYNIKFLGKKTRGHVESKGALSHKAKKSFKSSINFIQGCQKASGGESEYVTLLDKEVKAHSIPILLCTEDDVVGEHAASAGQIDENKMFYLMSRGLDKDTAKILVVESSFEPILEYLPDKLMREEIGKRVRKILEGGKSENRL